MINKTTCWAVFAYGLAIVVLGILGYLLKESLVSLIAGVGFGILLLISSWLMFSHNRAGIYAATTFTFLLTITFSVRYTISQNSVPAILAVLSGAMLLFLLAKLAKWKRGE